MRPGDQRTFKQGQGNAVVLAVGLWAQRSPNGKQLHIHMTGTKNFHTTVTNDQKSKRYHRALFRNLRRILVTNQCWPFGDEGAETEQSDE
jgi:hypothetical protein